MVDDNETEHTAGGGGSDPEGAPLKNETNERTTKIVGILWRLLIAFPLLCFGCVMRIGCLVVHISVCLSTLFVSMH